ncbi:S9 family peptidase [bacterium]|nr:S9 family peptidase [bacterium]MBU1881824.1 S9 family peptidase [bacterium]
MKHFAIISLLLLIFTFNLQAEEYSYEQYLNIRSASGNQLSPDGKSVLFMSDITGINQAYLIDADGGWPHQLTFFEDGADGANLSRDGETILVTADVGGNERRQFYLTSPRGEAPRRITYSDESIYSFGGWSHDGSSFAYSSNVTDAHYFDVYIYDLTWGTSRLLYGKESSFTSMGWSPDDHYIVVRDYITNYDANLYLVDVHTGDAKLLTPHEGLAQYHSIRWTPDSKGFYFVTDQDSEFYGLAYYTLENEGFAWFEKPTWDVKGVTLSEDGRYLAWTTNEGGYDAMRIRDLFLDQDVLSPPLPDGIYGGFSFSDDFSKMALTYYSPTHTADVWIYDLKTKAIRQVTHSAMAGIDRASLIRPILVHYPTFDGMEIPGFLYLPPGAKKSDKLPVVVKMHGGPESQTRPWLSTSTQFFVNKGLAVFEPNVRGSTGYGKTYTHLDDVEKRLDSVKDMEYGARWLISEGYADPERLAVFGGSYGGYMVLAALTEQPDLWAVGVDIVGIANFVTFLEKTGDWRRRYRETEYGSLEHDREFLKSISPLHKVKNIRVPLMVIQGANDPRVPAYESEQIVKALQKKKLPVKYLLYEDEGHGLAKLKNKLDAYPQMAEFLLEHLGVE